MHDVHITQEISLSKYIIVSPGKRTSTHHVRKSCPLLLPPRYNPKMISALSRPLIG
jgi:hypothetical protein